MNISLRKRKAVIKKLIKDLENFTEFFMKSDIQLYKDRPGDDAEDKAFNLRSRERAKKNKLVIKENGEFDSDMLTYNKLYNFDIVNDDEIIQAFKNRECFSLKLEGSSIKVFINSGIEDYLNDEMGIESYKNKFENILDKYDYELEDYQTYLILGKRGDYYA